MNRAFYNPLKIRDLTIFPPVVLAPMAGVTDLPFRKIHKEYGCPLAYTEMVSARGLFSPSDKSREFLAKEGEPPFCGVQLFGSDPGWLSEASRYAVSAGFDLIDINMGCPVKKIVKNGGGADLLKYPEMVKKIVCSVRKAAPDLPLTIKIRSGWNEEEKNFLEIGIIAEAEGVDAITIHPRTRMQQFTGKAKWDDIRKLKERVKIPVIGNGDVKDISGIKKMLSETGCDGVMIGRAALGNPWLFQEILSESRLPVQQAEKKKVMHKHLKESVNYYGEAKGALLFKKHLCWYLKGFKEASSLRKEIMTASNFKRLTEIIETAEFKT